MHKVFLDIAIILIFTKLGSIISKKFKQPQVLGALIAGVIIGPSILGIVHESEHIKLLAELGVVMLMFLAGLETNLDELKKAGPSSLLIAIGGIIVPLVLGFLPAYFMYDNLWESIFIGVILTATSVTISVQTLTEMNKLNTRAGINILGAAVIDDILGLIIISFVLVLAQSSQVAGGGDVLLQLLKVVGQVLIFCTASVAAIAFLPRYIDKYTKKAGSSQRIAVFSIGLTLLFAFLAEELGIAAITGAYVCGLMLSSVSHKHYIEKRVKTISTLFLTPIFFASIGLSVNMKDITLNIILLTLILLVVAIIGKVIGCSLPAKWVGMSTSESLQIGTGMVSRGEVALITTNIGLQSGIISSELFIPTLVVVLITTLITPILLKIVFSHKVEHKLDRKKAA
ncbi:potassium transporter [Clostridium polyendosporum]|uniref:Potassium transporter n=1 Tax=Clostridium polyendosporum TaxID=69208 RepID=A0A919VHA3_9CLOT|nr:cation:proton antiporter [Clostridium polyendosporum]GIM30047.1 potassium transporter [Clostridium polyendosporum]